MMKCDVKIMGAPKRKEYVTQMKNALGLSDLDIFFDDRPNGGHAMYTARKAWNLPFKEDITHRCVLQDDLEVCNGFNQAIQRIVNAHPNCIIGLYTSRNISKMETDTPFVEVLGGGVWGQAIIIPRSIIPKIFEWVDSINPDYPHDDAAISEYARLHGVKVLLTRWSLVQHLCPTNSLLKYNNKQKVSKVYIGNLNAENIFWESKAPMPKISIKSCVEVD